MLARDSIDAEVETTEIFEIFLGEGLGIETGFLAKIRSAHQSRQHEPKKGRFYRCFFERPRLNGSVSTFKRKACLTAGKELKD